MAIQVGDTVGDYRVEAVLGRGGMGKVFRVRSLLTGREEAMKVILPDVDDADHAERFLREIRVHASLSHPNIAALYTAFRSDGRIFMILELVDGVSLEDKLRQVPLPPGTATALISQVLEALEYAHARGVIHRDIKPANILVTAAGHAKLTDFGIARAEGDLRLTQTGFALGSLPYMSPEQIQSGPVDARSDIYSLGITFYELVTGRRPIHADSGHALMNAHFHQIPVPPADVSPAIPRALSDVILKSIAKRPADRYQTAAEFRHALLNLDRTVPSAASSALPPDSLIAPEALARVEARLSEFLGPIARHLVADAARQHATFADLCTHLSQQIPGQGDRDAFLKACTTGSPAGPRTWDPALLSRLTEVLAPHLGPIARVVVNRAAKAATTEEELYSKVAADIPSETDRKRFLASRR